MTPEIVGTYRPTLTQARLNIAAAACGANGERHGIERQMPAMCFATPSFVFAEPMLRSLRKTRRMCQPPSLLECARKERNV